MYNYSYASYFIYEAHQVPKQIVERYLDRYFLLMWSKDYLVSKLKENQYIISRDGVDYEIVSSYSVLPLAEQYFLSFRQTRDPETINVVMIFPVRGTEYE